MDNAEFLGVYAIRPGGQAAALPVANESGLWQVWQAKDGSYLIQPVDLDKNPWGSISSLGEAEFLYTLQPYTVALEEARQSPKRVLRSDAPNLLEVWYEESIGGSLTHRQGADKAQVSSGQTKDLLEYAFPSMSINTARGEKEVASSHTSIAPPQVFEGTDEEAKNALVEKQLREEFAALLARLDASPHRPMDKEFEAFFLQPRELSWEHKYTFSEFGMALRRRKKPALALLSHRKALELAPKDGHVLFNVARSEYETGDLAGARVHLKEALEDIPDFTAASNFLAFLTSQSGTVSDT